MDDYFVVQTVAGGDCSNNHRIYSAKDGKYIAAYSFVNRSKGMPIVLRAGAFNPNAFRFLTYRDNYWTCGKQAEPLDAQEPLPVGGVISYASPSGVIQKLALLYDEKAANDPSADPDSIEMSYKSSTKKFNWHEEGSPAEYDYWWRSIDRDLKPEEQGSRIFSKITVKLVWPNDSISIPIENDRLDIKKATLGKYFKKLVEISNKDQDQY